MGGKMLRLCLVVLACVGIAGAQAQGEPGFDVSFNHGVASGDPLPDAIILWTRITPRVAYNVSDTIAETSADYQVEKPADVAYEVNWSVSRNNDMSNPEAKGTFKTTYDRDWTVKVDVTGLQHSTQYHYQFSVGSGGSESPIGHFRLQPPGGANLDKLRYGVFTCSSWPWGYFNAYDYASQLGLDFWLHLGDNIYEYGPDTYPGPREAVRYNLFPWGLQPGHETVVLDDYRARYATYRLDEGLQALHASAPMIVIWDDHEHANDPWKGGAENHQPEDEGKWSERKKVSVRAFHEWMPTRSGAYGQKDYIGEQIGRTFEFGNLAKLVALENRLTARTRQIPPGAPGGLFPEGPFGPMTSILGTTPPEDWNATQIAGIKKLRSQINAVKNAPNRHIPGVAQLANLKKEAGGSQKWLLVEQTTNVNDIISNFGAAVKLMKKYNKNIASLWEEAIYNVTHVGNTAKSYSTSPYLLSKLGQPVPLDEATVAGSIANYAFGEYNMINWFDPWHAHTAERTRLLKALEPAKGNAIVYGGDTHAAFAGMLELDGAYVGAEFSSPGVTSPDREDGSLIPLELHNAANLAGSNVWMDTRYKGFQLVTLTQELHHVDFITVPWGSQNYKPNCQYAFDLYAAGGKHGKGHGRRMTQKGGVGSQYGLPVSVVEEKMNVLGKKANRPSLDVVPCYPLKEAVPYSKRTVGKPITVGPLDVSSNVNYIAVY